MKNSGVYRAQCSIKKQGVSLITAQTNLQTALSYIVGSNSLILHLNAGEVVDISGCTNIDSIFTGTETSFTGFLLKAD